MAGLTMFVISRTSSATEASMDPRTGATPPIISCDIDARVTAPGAEFRLRARFEASKNASPSLALQARAKA